MATKRPGDGTAIEWTHVPGYKGVTWNPTVGCTRVSAGCDHCYAFALHDRRYADNRRALLMPQRPWPAQYDQPFSHVQVIEDRIEEPLHWRAPRAVFVDSMADLFHEHVPMGVLDRIFAVMEQTPQHIYMILTKRATRMRNYVKRRYERVDQFDGLPLGTTQPPANVWLGVSVEDQEAAHARIPILLDAPAAVRFLSCEPLLGPIDFKAVQYRARADALLARQEPPPIAKWLGLHWVIVGGESGPHHRPMDEDWARSIRDQCDAAGVAFFYKQPSALRPGAHGPPDLDDLKAWPEVAGAKARADMFL